MDKKLQEFRYTTPETIQRINQENRDCIALLAQESKERCEARCVIYKEEIMMKVWHPSRVEKLIKMGYDIEDM